MTMAPDEFSPVTDEEAICEEAFHSMLDVIEELMTARKRFAPMHSAHEGFAILKEEVDELWEEVRKPNCKRTAVNISRMRREATQVAAMALRFIIDCCEPTV